MAGEIKMRLAKEAKILEQWRRMYMVQALVVALISGAVIFAVWKYADFLEVRVLLSLAALAFFYEMCKALRASLQARSEGMILAAGEEVLGEAIFDVGRGLCENALLAQEICPPYQLRECRNVMRGKGFWLEEDWFYSVISAKFLPLYQTMFEGVILAFVDVEGEDGMTGHLLLKNGRAVITGDLAAHLKRNNAIGALETFMRMFGAKKAELATADKMLYLWIATDKKLFYQFSLFKMNTLAPFQRRIELLHKASETLLEALNH